jgi:hypothetical protein
MATEHFETCFKKRRGMARRSLDLIEAMHAAAEAAQPITGRGIGYKLFTAGLIPSMAKKEMQRVYRLLKEAREQELIPWEWIVDETRSLERTATWADPAEYADCVARSYRRDFWNQQPIRCEVWSEKGTVRGVLEPVLDHYAVGFRVMHGFSGATTIYDVSRDDEALALVRALDRRQRIALERRVAMLEDELRETKGFIAGVLTLLGKSGNSTAESDGEVIDLPSWRRRRDDAA